MKAESNIKFYDVPKSRKFKTKRSAMFKQEDGMRSMAFSETMKIEIRVSAVESKEAKKHLEALADTTLAEAKKIIAEYEILQ